MAGPTPNFDTVEVRGRYVGIDGTKPTGEVIFELDASRLVDGAAKTSIVAVPIKVELIDGAFAAQIPATDDPDIAPDGFTWHVTENFFGGGNFHIQVPLNQQPFGIEIAEVVPVTAAPGEFIPQEITRLEFNNLEGRVVTLEGELGSFVSDSDLSTGLATKANEADLLAHTGDHNNPHVVTKSQVGLGNVDNTSDANKPVSDPTQAALNLKANLASPTFTGTVGGLTKFMVGLGNVDNTADTAKPVSTAVQAALDTIQDEIDAISVTGGTDADVAGYVNDVTPSATRAALDALYAGAGAVYGFFFPEQYGAVGNGTTDDSSALVACFNAANSAGGGIVLLSKVYGFTGDLTQKDGVTVIGVGAGLDTTKGAKLLALDATARYRFGNLTGNPYPGMAMNFIVDGAGVADGSGTELFRCEAVETSLHQVVVRNSAGVGVNLASSQNLNFFNCNFGSCPNGDAILLKGKQAGSQPPGHCIFYGGHFGDSKLTIRATSHDATFFVGPHDNMFIGSIIETGRIVGNAIDGIIALEDGDTHFLNCTFTIGAQPTAINNDCSILITNDIRTSVSTTCVLSNTTIGGGAGAVKATDAVRVKGGAGHVSNNVVYSIRTGIANVTHMHCHDTADGLVTVEGPVVFITGVTDQFRTVNGGTLSGVLRNTQVPQRYAIGSAVSNPIQIRRDSDPSFNRWQVTRDGNMQWLDGTSSTIQANILRSGAGLAINGANIIQIYATTTVLRPAASTVQYRVILDLTLNKLIWSDGTNYRDAMGTIV